MPYPLHCSLQHQHLVERVPARAMRRVVRDLIAVQAQYASAAAPEVNASPFGRLSRAAHPQLQAEAERVARFYGLASAVVNVG